MQPFVTSVAYCSGCPSPVLCAADNALGLFLFRKFSESSWSPRIICSSIVLQHQTLLPQVLGYGHNVIVPGFQFARPPVVFLVENVAIQHHPGYDVESYLFPITNCPSFIQRSVQHHKLVGCDDFWFYLWIATMFPPYFLFLGCGVAGEKNDKIFFL
jgi:hypothetical protein